MSVTVAMLPQALPTFAMPLADRLRAAGCAIVDVQPAANAVSARESPEPRSPVDVLIVCLATGRDRKETADRIFDLVERIRDSRDATGALPRRVVALLHPAPPAPHDAPHVAEHDDLHDLSRTLLQTLLIYLTAHTVHEDTRINGVDVGAADPDLEQSGLDVVLALASGMLDGVRGQLLRPARIR